MARIEYPESGMGDHVDWSLSRTEMAIGMGTFSKAVYGNSQLPVREREAARYTIAMINDCRVCRATRAERGVEAGIDEGFYGEIANRRTSTVLTDRERLAAEFAERFALDHLGMDDAFWAQLRSHFADPEIADLTIACSMFLGLGRALAVLDVAAPEQHLLV
jgi:alkylhydroperoxidase family enzyme